MYYVLFSKEEKQNIKWLWLSSGRFSTKPPDKSLKEESLKNTSKAIFIREQQQLVECSYARVRTKTLYNMHNIFYRPQKPCPIDTLLSIDEEIKRTHLHLNQHKNNFLSENVKLLEQNKETIPFIAYFSSVKKY